MFEQRKARKAAMQRGDKLYRFGGFVYHTETNSRMISTHFTDRWGNWHRMWRTKIGDVGLVDDFLDEWAAKKKEMEAQTEQNLQDAIANNKRFYQCLMPPAKGGNPYKLQMEYKDRVTGDYYRRTVYGMYGKLVEILGEWEPVTWAENGSFSERCNQMI